MTEAIKNKIIDLYKSVEMTKNDKFKVEVFKENYIKCKTQQSLIKKLGYDPRIKLKL